ncbi:hypothetical protein V6N11_067786 [Hibiscus sabdariffa]|uniref:Uncharacterized protein n=1 Tax=Hibiscus sabdariffa TaxID=183260 RepID=A0ABR2SRV9_9ROSI
MKLSESHYLEPRGIVGGLASTETQVTILKENKNLIDTCISISGDNEWFCTFIYGPPYLEGKQEFWEELSKLRNQRNAKWCIIGDSNVVADKEEKLSGNPFVPLQAKWYHDFLDDSGMMELAIKGVMEAAIAFDHAPIILLLSGLKKKWKKDFKFESKWLLEEECSSNVKEAWKSILQSSNSKTFGRKLKTTRAKLSKWSRKKFGNNKKSIEEIKKRLLELQDGSLTEGIKGVESDKHYLDPKEKEFGRNCNRTISEHKQVFSFLLRKSESVDKSQPHRTPRVQAYGRRSFLVE